MGIGSGKFITYSTFLVYKFCVLGNNDIGYALIEQGIPRTVMLDKKTGSNLLQWPVAEVESLRLKSDKFENLKAKPGTVVPLDIATATQV